MNITIKSIHTIWIAESWTYWCQIGHFRSLRYSQQQHWQPNHQAKNNDSLVLTIKHSMAAWCICPTSGIHCTVWLQLCISLLCMGTDVIRRNQGTADGRTHYHVGQPACCPPTCLPLPLSLRFVHLASWTPLLTFTNLPPCPLWGEKVLPASFVLAAAPPRHWTESLGRHLQRDCQVKRLSGETEAGTVMMGGGQATGCQAGHATRQVTVQHNTMTCQPNKGLGWLAGGGREHERLQGPW